jgi:hypothetical protein
MNIRSEPLAQGVFAVDLARSQQFDPATALCDQFVITESPTLDIPGFRSLTLQGWTVHYGAQVRILPMADHKGRLFGAFIGIGVDPDGVLIDAARFARLDSTAPDFDEAITALLNYTAGRWMAVVDTGRIARLHFDAVAHMTTLYNPRLRRAGSCVALCLDRPWQPNPMFDTEAILTGTARGEVEPNYILQHSRDAEVLFALPNHVLDLRTFRLQRIWPLVGSFPEAAPEEYAGLVAQMVDRLRQTMAALVNGHPSILAVSGGTDSRKLLACMGDHHDKVAEYFCFEHTDYAKLDAQAGEYITGLLGLPFRRIGRGDGKPAETATERRQRMRLFWLRSSGVALPPNEHLFGLTEVVPEGHLHLRGNVMDLMRSVWWRSFANRHRKVPLGLRDEIGSLFLTGTPSREMVEKWAGDYYRWRHGLPENAQALVYDFIFLELFLHVSSAKYYAFDRNFYICPFSDRRLIELTLRFPVDFRFDGHLNTMFMEAADPRLANQPHRGGVRDLVRSGAFVPSVPV